MSVVLIYEDRAVIGSFRYFKREKTFVDVELRAPFDVLFQELGALENITRRTLDSFEIHRGESVAYTLEHGIVVSFAIDDVDVREGYAKLALKIDFSPKTTTVLMG